MIIHILRKPLDGTVAANAMAHGAGALNIDGCRIGDSSNWTKTNGAAGSGFKTGKFMGGNGLGEPTQVGVTRQSNLGRWPANLVLAHLQSCVCSGVKKVKSKQITAGRRTGAWGVQRGGDTYEKGTGAVLAGDGTETVADWQCDDRCPVHRLDESTAHLHSAGYALPPQVKWMRDKYEGVTGWGVNKPSGGRIGGSGGASRFFQQVDLCPPSN